MHRFNGLALAAAFGVLTALPGGAVADVNIYPYPSKHNFCPAGLQPVTIDGTVSCGRPNQHVSYEHVNAHPVTRKKHRKVARHKPYHARSYCEVGTKGCTFD
ncbi:hypothetical protein OS189_00710 [Sulfitobacter sp. F26169L]|uniref:hypothetical protein n=1 Tax=Sulfitobacter sp. F26169L TaxID=2996015 RepID=UPI002260ABF8|nr:hypothetical protein [Sulfitobacter sp. F26169L]MCX7564861.1 hypothetical protein [Sulfitobacter sp. F26169L]